MRGQPWNKQQRYDLLSYFGTGMKVEEIAKVTGRSASGIVHQLAKLKVLFRTDSGWVDSKRAVWVTHVELWHIRLAEGNPNA